MSPEQLNGPSELLVELLNVPTEAANSELPQNVDAQAPPFDWTSTDENKRLETMCLLIDSLRVNEKVGDAADYIMRYVAAK